MDSSGARRWLTPYESVAGVTVDPIEGAFVLNIGDMMRIWTNGLYRSTPHRVLRPAPGCGRRLSIPFFFEPNYDARQYTSNLPN